MLKVEIQLLLHVFFLQNAYATYVKEYYVKSFGASVETYNQQHLKNAAVRGDTADRLWWFQVCTEVAYFQVAPSNDSIRSSKVDTRHVYTSYLHVSDILQTFLSILFSDFFACQNHG